MLFQTNAKLDGLKLKMTLVNSALIIALNAPLIDIIAMTVQLLQSVMGLVLASLSTSLTNKLRVKYAFVTSLLLPQSTRITLF